MFLNKKNNIGNYMYESNIEDRAITIAAILLIGVIANCIVFASNQEIEDRLLEDNNINIEEVIEEEEQPNIFSKKL